MFIKTIAAIIWFLITVKNLFFWAWLWQLKEYHFGRFRAHFESRAAAKITSGFWRIKIPKITKKIVLILLFGLVLETLFLIFVFPSEPARFYIYTSSFFVFSPLIFSALILIFQIPTEFLKKRILKKAERKIAGCKNLLVIGVAGSYGKTSTKDFLAQILSAKFKVLKTGEHINSEIGVARTVLGDLGEEKEIFVAEIGAYEKGKIKEVCRMIKPKIGVLTGINKQHLSTFGSLENIIQAKFELIESLPENGLAIFNGNNELIKLRVKNQKSKVQVKNQKLIQKDSGDYEAVLKNLLPWDRENFLMAAAAAEFLGMSDGEIKKAAENIKSQIKIIRGLNGAEVILSVYSANPKSVFSHLEYLSRRPGKKTLIMPCLIELGRASREIHREIGEKIGIICDLAIITTKDKFKELRAGAMEKGMLPENIIFCANPEKIFERIKSFAGRDETILLESRVPKRLINLLTE